MGPGGESSGWNNSLTLSGTGWDVNVLCLDITDINSNGKFLLQSYEKQKEIAGKVIELEIL